MPVTVKLPEVVCPPRVSVKVPPPFAKWPGPAFSWPLPLRASMEPSAAMAVSDDPGGTAPITHVYDAWLSVARLARAGAAPTAKVLATMMATTNILFIGPPFCRGPGTRTCEVPQLADIRQAMVYSAAAVWSRAGAHPRHSGLCVPGGG